VSLTAASTSTSDNVLTQFIKAVITDTKASAPRPYAGPVKAADAPAYLAAGFAAAGIRTVEGTVLSPLQLVELASAIANGDKQGVSNAIANTVDGPLWMADPALYALGDTLPAPLGGNSGLVRQFRDANWAVTQNINATLQQALGLPADNTGNTTAAGGSGLTGLADIAAPAGQANGVKSVVLNVPAPKAPAKVATDVKTTVTDTKPLPLPKTGNLFKPGNKADNNGAQSDQQAQGPFSGVRDSIRNTVKNATKAVGGDNAGKPAN
jgi:hypothetical protein